MTTETKRSPAFFVAEALTTFVGRRRELEEAKVRMGESRLLTLTGPGGVGKTRLAVELAARSAKAFRDGVVLVELASVEEASGLLPAVLAALAVPDQSPRPGAEKLVDYLREKHLLLVMDNCEHLLEAVAAMVSDLLHRAPNLRILATSREPLGIAGEQMYPVPPLATPGPDQALQAAGLGQYEAVQLLLDRVRSIVPDFALTEENREAVAQLCKQLDGIPLAIELAATRLRALSVTELVERLDRRFQLLRGGDRAALPRQRSLGALVGWSYELCTVPEQQLWARISVFPGGFDLAAAEEVCGFDGLDAVDIIDHLDRLVAKSIVTVEPHGQRLRYRQLMTFRHYGMNLLDAAGEYEAIKARQRDHYLRRASAMVGRWCGPGQAETLTAMRHDHANLISVLEWSSSRPSELRSAAKLASLLRYHWIAGGFLSGGRRWLDRILSQLHEPSAERGDALWVAAWVCLIQGDREAATAYLAACHQDAAALGSTVLEAHASHWSALHELFSGRLPEAIALFGRAIAVHREAGDTASELTALFQLAMAQNYDGDVEAALRTSRSALELSDEHAERWNHAYSLWVTGLCHWHSGELESAREAARKALELQREFKDSICTALAIELLSWIAVQEDHPRDAAELYLAANAVWTGLGTTVEAFGPEIHADSLRAAEEIRRRVGADRFAEIGSGRAPLDKDAAIAFALGSADERGIADKKTESPLTKRENEIAGLVAQGLSNRSIAQNLVISQRTVDGHLERILGKLGFTSRVQVATWSAGRVEPDARHRA